MTLEYCAHQSFPRSLASSLAAKDLGFLFRPLAVLRFWKVEWGTGGSACYFWHAGVAPETCSSRYRGGSVTAPPEAPHISRQCATEEFMGPPLCREYRVMMVLLMKVLLMRI